VIECSAYDGGMARTKYLLFSIAAIVL